MHKKTGCAAHLPKCQHFGVCIIYRVLQDVCFFMIIISNSVQLPSLFLRLGYLPGKFQQSQTTVSVEYLNTVFLTHSVDNLYCGKYWPFDSFPTHTALVLQYKGYLFQVLHSSFWTLFLINPFYMWRNLGNVMKISKG